jgi:hypothetical protein
MDERDPVSDAQLDSTCSRSSDERGTDINPGASQPMIARPGAQHLPGPAARSSTLVPGDRYNARPKVASFSLVNGLWMRWLLSRITNLRGRSSILVDPSMQVRTQGRT